MNTCIYCREPLTDDAHALPSARCWIPSEEVDLTGASSARWIYQAGWRIGRDGGDREGFRRGYVYGHRDGEHHARLSDDAFVDAVARRVLILDNLEAAVSETVRSTISAIDALAYRARKRGELS